ARDLVTHYGDKRVLDGVSCRVAQGEVFVVIGASGCGKTTLLKHLTGLLKPTSGEVLHSGEDITVLDEERLSQIQRKIGIAFQSGGLFNSMTVGENVALPLREYGGIRDKGLIEAIVRLKLSLVGLEAAQHLLPDALSGGMRKRAGLARAIALDPPLVFFDEPSAGLDPIMAAGLDDLVLRLRKLLGITFVIVTHELDSIRSIADHILMLDRGQVIFGGTLEDAERTDMARVRQFFERRADDRISQRNV
ncbi:MAG TPA: ATP-binding cassette domain-containing protein, partial [Candidatus Hydrogenedentes bacterium]|nr:ATP-binding cassette domain-containing protein [Candidatus Hydrogenedentota bacterium]